MPGITLNFIGKVESFDRDFTRVIDHVRAWDRLRPVPDLRFNASEHQPWPSYYTNILADTVYRAYERDFDQFGYPRKIPLYRLLRGGIRAEFRGLLVPVAGLRNIRRDRSCC